MKDYRLIAMDLDGTLLNSRKEISPESIQAVDEICAAGKTAVFDTGRAVSELADVIAVLPQVRYAVYASGAGLYDIHERKPFGLRSISPEDSEKILSLARTIDVMPQIVLPERNVIQESHMEHLERYHMDVYRPLYEKAMTLVPDLFAFAASCREPFLKINLYHAVADERVRTRALLSSLNLETVYSEISSLECSAGGVNKGSGLEILCGLLGISPKQCIAVGDADNDLPMFRASGLGIAMGNAAEHIKTAAGLVVADLDHGGCAQAIRMLLSKG